MRRNLRLTLGSLGGALVVIAVVLGLGASHALRNTDLSTIDARFTIRGSLGPPHDLVIVGIDATTIGYMSQAHPSASRPPFPRRYDATVIANLARAGAKVIAVDLQFSEQTDTTDDNDLILAVRAAHAHNVVLAATGVLAHGVANIFGGGQGLAYSRATGADSQVPIDSDGKWRRFNEQIFGLTTFPVVAAEKALGHPVAFPGGRDATADIDYRGNADTVPEIPYSSVLSGKFAASAVRGKIVVLGDTEPTLQDVHATPTAAQMSGPEIQANAIDTVLRGFPLKPAPGWLNFLLVVAFALLAPLLAIRLSALVTVGVAIVTLAVFAVVCQLAFDSGTIVAFIYPALALVLSGLAALLVRALTLQHTVDLLPAPVSAFFISYRRGQSELAANTLRTGLEHRFGRGHVFMDTEAIAHGESWPQRIEDAIAGARAMLVVIGPQWLDAQAPDGSRRLEDPGDWVRRETETALAREQVVVVPVLHDGAQPPSPGQLPESLQALAECQAVSLTGREMEQWIDALSKSIDEGRLRRSQSTAPERPMPAS